VRLMQEGTSAQPSPSVSAATESVRGEVARTLPLDDGAEIVVNAIVGNIVVEGTDDNTVQVIGEQFVRVASSQQALTALEALAVDVTQTARGIEITTKELEDMAALGTSYHRVDLRILCPRNAQLRIRAASGATTLRDLAATIEVEQAQGTVAIERVDGSINVRNQAGDVSVFDSSGPITVSNRSGDINTRTISGRQTLSNTDGRTIIDAPGNGVVARQSGGDVRIIALDGIHGPHDIRVEQGNISIVRPEWADAEYIVTVEGGEVDTVLPLTGAISRDRIDARGRQNEGTHEVKLTAIQGDVVID
jgi:DUF4097 and DUF4098 domain-containing protein YvlB